MTGTAQDCPRLAGGLPATSRWSATSLGGPSNSRRDR